MLNPSFLAHTMSAHSNTPFYPALQGLYNYISGPIRERLATFEYDWFYDRASSDAYYEHVGDLSFFSNFGALPRIDELNTASRMILLLALAPHLHPYFYDLAMLESFPEGDIPVEFGGLRNSGYHGLIPTIDTALLLLAGSNPKARRELLLTILNSKSRLLESGILTLGELPAGEPEGSRPLIIAPHALHYFLYDEYFEPVVSEPEPNPSQCVCQCSTPTPTTPTPDELPADFPAQEITPLYDWNKLVLAPNTRALVEDVRNWVKNRNALNNNWGMGGLFKPGYRVLFYGPSGTGKTMTALLLGGDANERVYRVDLSMVMSKYIGETEKNLGKLFDNLHGSNKVLFFDEADALFGKRTETRDAHDRFANQEVAYLLQRIEEYDGLVILASNLKGNLDTAFSRRFQAMIPFAMPTAIERRKLWKNIKDAYPTRFGELLTDPLANRYELSGASIVNVVQFAALRALAYRPVKEELQYDDLIEGIRSEYQKDGRLL